MKIGPTAAIVFLIIVSICFAMTMPSKSSHGDYSGLIFVAVCALLVLISKKSKVSLPTSAKSEIKANHPENRSTTSATHVLTSDDFTENMRRCFMLSELNKPAEAQAAAGELITLYPNEAQPRILLAELLVPSGKTDFISSANKNRALALCTEALSLAPENPSAHRVLGRVLAARGNLQQAVVAVEEGLRLEPEDIPAIIDATNIYYRLGNDKKVCSLCDRGLELDPENFALLNNKSLGLWRMRDLEGAARSLNEAMSVNPTAPFVHYNQGWVARELGKSDLALTHFKAALRLAPNDRDYLECVISCLPRLPMNLRFWWLLSQLFSGFVIVIRDWISRRIPFFKTHQLALTISLFGLHSFVTGLVILLMKAHGFSWLSILPPLNLNFVPFLVLLTIVMVCSWTIAAISRSLFLRAAQPVVAKELAGEI